MEIIFLVVGIIVVVQIVLLRQRITELEHTVAILQASISAPTTVATNLVADRPLTPAETAARAQLREYIKDQLARGSTRDRIEAALSHSGWQASDVASVFASLPVGAAAASVYQSSYHSTAHPGEAAATGGLLHWLATDWLLKIGALLFLMAIGWFTSYAFMNDWIGPVGRITLGIVFGAALLGLGWWRMQRYVTQGGVFLVVGSTVIILTIYAARVTYDFFTPGSALVMMFLTTVFVAVASVVYKSRALAVASLLLATLAPLLTNPTEPSLIGLFTYLGAVVLGTLWVVVVTGQRSLTLIALIITGLYSLPFLVSAGADQSLVLQFVFGFAALFFLTHTVGVLRSAKTTEVTVDLCTAGLNGLWLTTWILVAVPKEWQSLVLVAWMLVFTVASFLVFRNSGKYQVLLTYAGVAVAMLAAATAVELDGAALTIAFTLETAIIVVCGYLLTRSSAVAYGLSTLLVVPFALSLPSIFSSAWWDGVIHQDFFVLIIMTLTLLGLALFFKQRAAGGAPGVGGLVAPLSIFGSYLGLVVWWLSLHALFDTTVAVVIALVTYIVIGLACYVYGVANGSRGVKIYGGVLIVLVVLRLLFVEIWALSLEGRIIAFFVIGLLLMGTAFIGKRTKK